MAPYSCVVGYQASQQRQGQVRTSVLELNSLPVRATNPLAETVHFVAGLFRDGLLFLWLYTSLCFIVVVVVDVKYRENIAIKAQEN